MKRYIKYCLVGTMAFAACSKNFQDPTGPSSSQAYSSPTTITDATVGLQAWYSKDRTGLLYNTITAGTLLTGEAYVTNSGNADEAQLTAGGVKVLNTNAVVNQLWAVSTKIVYESNNILAATPKVITDPGYASGVIAYTSIFKAWAMGVQANFFQQIPDTSGKPDNINDDVHFIPGQQGYLKAAAILDNAINVVKANPVSASIAPYLPQGINIINTLYALKARYALYGGDYVSALAAANNVDLTVKSTLNFNAQVNNPIYALVTATNNIWQTTGPTMGLPTGFQPSPADLRVPFYIVKPTSGTLPYVLTGFYTTPTSPVPVYLPGEVILIKAECYARQNDIPNGLAQLNKVVTKLPSADAFGVGAGLPAIASVSGQQALLDSIYQHRRIELYSCGQELEDSRRFNRPVAERKRSYLPYPLVERNDNPNTPADPAF
ncbi:SusD-like starch-binding protein associating with outer membrane [Chitinophaga dinghuensis]|uniref:SusD-like starch-binding protein associating with outer membrane n=1 Tax=Chitinophaga dinghuensis TaxID=1539050 RepID=A0A327VNK4_9BACT|nr:RagB/SusD family nutrient uptake outer membrane protein [Chitinophaga dinghuensis]RAJ74997.1 SusD-like starch-binding protein associating with outer membrane [Chitinophaga dinghuensis]